MVVEIAVVAGFFLLMSMIFARGGHKDWAFATLPMILVPLVYVVLEVIVISLIGVNVNIFAGTFTMIVAVVASAAWIGVVSHSLKSKRTSLTYVAISNAFNIALTAIIVSSMLEKSGVFKFLLS